MTEQSQAKPIGDYSLLDPEVQSDPYGFYERLHRECPVYRMPETGMYVITRYGDLRDALKDTGRFSSDTRLAAGDGLQGALGKLYQDILSERGWGHVQTLQRTDPPEHSRYRKLLDRVFTAKRVREMAPYIDGVVNELIDRFADAGECEFIGDFAMPMPGIIIAEQLGLDRAEVKTFKKWADAMLAMATKRMTEAEIRAVADTELEAQHFLHGVMEARRAEPGDDLISALVHAHGEDEAPLSMHELQNLMHQLITGGFETTQSAIAHAMWLLVRQPELQDALRRDPGKIKNFVEESLRWESPVQGLARVTTCDVEMGGTTIPAGSLVIVRYGAANRDADKFECPHLFDLERRNAGSHLAFGSGAHFCVGAMLARQEITASISLLLDRLENIRLARGLPHPVHESSLFFLPIKEMHLTFDGRGR
ncbi:MAG: cytochrome P450 [Alphaproteobacteria bacterium]|nr:cytochrome P450 [Alphaproteobacteria bacterium]